MTLAAGSRLEPYEIVGPIGAGGEVYRARDQKLDREVAIKVLPDRLGENPDALARFERQAKAVAAPSPNILSMRPLSRRCDPLKPRPRRSHDIASGTPRRRLGAESPANSAERRKAKGCWVRPASGVASSDAPRILSASSAHCGLRVCMTSLRVEGAIFTAPLGMRTVRGRTAGAAVTDRSGRSRRSREHPLPYHRCPAPLRCGTR